MRSMKPLSGRSSERGFTLIEVARRAGDYLGDYYVDRWADVERHGVF